LITLCIRQINSSANAIPSCKCEQMDGLCYTHNKVKALCCMFMRSWAILGSNKPTFFFRHNIGGMRCNYKFNNLFLGVSNVWLNVGVIWWTYISFTTMAHHGVWALMKFGFCLPTKFDSPM
jgi:hypothetical protein